MTPPVALIEASAAIIGASGAGKTVTAKTMVEAMLQAQRHTVVVDPTGVWYGLRSNAAGTGPGFGIAIFGGLHGDVPIAASDGAKVAELVINGPLSAVIDVSELRSGSEQRRFMRDFMAAIRKKPKTRFHIVIDEADEFAPQTAPDDAGYALLEDMIWMAKRGRVHGFVPLLITQRPADIAKAVLSQMQTLIVHQLIHPTDQAPVKAYLKGHASKDVAAEIERSLAGLQRGERWIYAPALGILERGVSPLPITFDTSRTPEAGESVAVPATLASIDASALRAALAPVQSSDQSGQLAQVGSEAETVAQLRAELAQMTADRDAWRTHAYEGDRKLDAIRELLCGAEIAVVTSGEPGPIRLTQPFIVDSTPGVDTSPGPTDLTVAALPPAAAADSSSAISRSAEKLIEAVAKCHPRPITERQAATIAGVSMKSSAWRTNRADALASGMLNLVVDRWSLSPSGIAALGKTKPITLAQLQSMLPPSAARMLGALADSPMGMTKGQIADAAGISPTSSGLGTGLRELVLAGFAELRGNTYYIAKGIV